MEVMRSSGTSTSDFNASRTWAAIVSSDRSQLEGMRTCSWFTTSSTPRTRCAASTAASFLGYELMNPVSVTMAPCTCTPTSVASTTLSHASSFSTSFWMRVSDDWVVVIMAGSLVQLDVMELCARDSARRRSFGEC